MKRPVMLNLKVWFTCLLTQFGAVSFAHNGFSSKDELIPLLQPMLNSERINHLFGSYGVDVLPFCDSMQSDTRLSNLYSQHDNKKVMRTLAFVKFNQQMPQSLLPAHQQIEAGASIGSTLKEHGWSIEKKPVYFGELELNDAVLKMMHEKHAQKAAVFIYELNVQSKDTGQKLTYCTIIEIYSPQYLTLAWLQKLYQTQYDNHLVINESNQASLKHVMDCLDNLIQPN